jgi:hypothetical protein
LALCNNAYTFLSKGVGRIFIIDSAHLKYMAEKKHYLIKVWDISGLKVPSLEQVKDSKTKSKESYVVEEKNTDEGFDLLQEKIIRCYENIIQNIHVPKGFRATYEEVKAPKEDTKKAQSS